MARAVAAVARSTATLLVFAALTGCGGGSEYLVLERFFKASDLRDRTALARFSTTIFEPRVDGTLDTFRIVTLGPETVAQPSESPASSSEDSRMVALLSLDNPVDPVDLDGVTPAIVHRIVTIEADIRRPDGHPVTTKLDVVLAKAVVDRPRRREGRWIVTSFK